MIVGKSGAILPVMKTVLITGCSSGYGLETARHFHARGWNVIATMRTPREDVLPRSDRLRVLALDVTKPESIAAAVESSGPIDVLVNNAGIGVRCLRAPLHTRRLAPRPARARRRRRSTRSFFDSDYRAGCD